MSSEEVGKWRRCSFCKTDIDFEQLYWVCNVSTCNRKRTGLIFCEVSCWDAHVPQMRHRESWAVEKTSPSREAFAREQAPAKATQLAPTPAREKSTSTGTRRLVRPSSAVAIGASASTPLAHGSGDASLSNDDIPIEILIVASKLKQYIKARSGMNTSEGAMKALSDHVRVIADRAIATARTADRKTVMDRDFPDPHS